MLGGRHGIAPAIPRHQDIQPGRQGDGDADPLPERRAAAEGRALSFAEVPASLAALAALYGVVELLQPGTGRSPAPAA